MTHVYFIFFNSVFAKVNKPVPDDTQYSESDDYSCFAAIHISLINTLRFINHGKLKRRMKWLLFHRCGWCLYMSRQKLLLNSWTVWNRSLLKVSFVFFKYESLKCVPKPFGAASGAEMTRFTFKEMVAKAILSDSVCSKCLTRIPHQIKCLSHDILPEQKPWVFKLQYPVKLLKTIDGVRTQHVCL